MDQFERECRMELQLCKVILSAIERRHNKSLRSQKVYPKCQKHLEILRHHQLELLNQCKKEV